MDSTAVFLFTLFHSDPLWTRSHAEEVKRTLGPYPASVATRACNIVKRILSYLPSEESSDSVPETSAISSEPLKMAKEFGHNIPFKFDEMTSTTAAGNEGKVKSKRPAGYKTKDSLPKVDDSLSEGEDSGPNVVTSTLLNGMATVTPQMVKVKESKPPSSSGASASAMDTGAGPYSAVWLKQQCTDCTKHGLSGLSWQDLYTAIFELLSSTGDSTAIQNDVS